MAHPAKLISGHQSFLSRYMSGEGAFLQGLAGARQRPGTLYIGCSDSRVVPELLTSASPGDLFVVRNIANQVPIFEHADASVGAALEYAVVHLHVPHIVVCGHSGCGGVRAAVDGLGDDPQEDPAEVASLREWLDCLAPVSAWVRDKGLVGQEGYDRAVQQNVLLQLRNLTTYPAIRRRLEAGQVALHGWVYDMFSLDLLIYDVKRDRFLPASQVAQSPAADAAPARKPAARAPAAKKPPAPTRKPAARAPAAKKPPARPPRKP